MLDVLWVLIAAVVLLTLFIMSRQVTDEALCDGTSHDQDEVSLDQNPIAPFELPTERNGEEAFVPQPKLSPVDRELKRCRMLSAAYAQAGQDDIARQYRERVHRLTEGQH